MQVKGKDLNKRILTLSILNEITQILKVLDKVKNTEVNPNIDGIDHIKPKCEYIQQEYLKKELRYLKQVVFEQEDLEHGYLKKELQKTTELYWVIERFLSELKNEGKPLPF